EHGLVTSSINHTRNGHDRVQRSRCNPNDRADRSMLTDSHALHVEITSAVSSSRSPSTAGRTSEEAAMQDVITISTTALDDSAHSHEPPLDAMYHGASAVGRATTRSNTPWLSRHVTARDLHPGDVVQQLDWPLHVRAVTLGPTAVQITVTEFDFPLHYP